MIELSFIITAFTTLFVVIDPIALTPIFATMTQGIETKHRGKMALRACLVSFGILAVFAVAGEAVMHFIGISMPAFRVAGGILLFLTALDMLFERRTKRREDQADDETFADDHDPSVFPLAVPLLAGPGAIATVILLAGQAPGVTGTAMVIGMVAIVLLTVYLSLLASSLFERALGKTGINVATRLLGMLLAALAVQFVLDGLRAFGFAS
ncbi:MarC family protein [Lentibacter algarum]|uniref:MarC family protein n=1 Tax=Lentibacter algarum TaxID=576131 RepID=UPI001C0823DA|nr:MarC family protein [Lentibacter algarum]MBU2982669.1 MarC family protein [Lentibacter algarum]